MSVPRDDRGVSPAVGVVLMVAIAVALAALFGLFVTGLELPESEPTNLAYDSTYVEDGAGNVGDRPYVNVTITGGRERFGDDVYVTDSDGNEVQWSAAWGGDLQAGDHFRIDGYGNDGTLNYACHDEVYRVVRRDDESGSSELVIQVRIDGYATGPAATYC
ncbi:MAG: type IV pilin [Haloferacaceae archaeon]